MKTPKIRYYLDNQKKLVVYKRIKKEPIMVEVNYGFKSFDNSGYERLKPFRVSLQKLIEPNKFGSADENFKFDKNIFDKATKNNATIRNAMRNFQNAIDVLESRYDLENLTPEPSEFKNDLLIQLGRKKLIKTNEVKILDYFNQKIEKSEEEVGMGKRSSLSKNTIKSYRTVKHHIETYQLATKSILTFKNFDKIMYWNFWDVLDDVLKDKIKVEYPNKRKKQVKQPNGYLRNSIRKYQVTLLRTLKDAVEDEVDLSLNVYDENLVLESVESRKDIYISEEELVRIIECNVADDEDLQKAKDYIIISSLTGMRFESMQDSVKSKAEVFKDDNYNFKYLHSKQNKTSTEVYIPLMKPVLDIIERNGNQLPVFRYNAKINKVLKILFKELGLSRMEDEVLRTYRGGEVRIKKPLYELITTHDNKKTFYTNLYLNKVLPAAIDNLTHPDKKTKNPMAKIYNKSSMLDKAKMFVDEINKIASEIYRF
jgi:hypothetical protein